MAKKAYVGAPETYEVLEYIQSTGTQYINTGFTPNQDTRVYAECVFATASSTQGLFGARISSSANQYQFVTSGNNYRSDYNTDANNVTNTSYGTTKFYVDKSKNVFDLNGDHSLTQTYAAFTCPGPMYIFATNNNGSVYAKATAKLYVFRVYDNSTLVRNMTPVKRGSDGAVGMYDRVNGVFYGNAGTGTFIAGAVTGEVITTTQSVAHKIKKGYVGVPETYEVLEYIESTGTQYIDLGFKPNQDTRIVVDATLTNIEGANGNGVGFIPYGANVFDCYSGYSGFIFKYNSTTNEIGATALGNRIQIDHNKNNVTVTSGSQKWTYSFSYASFATANNLIIFGCNWGSPILGSQKIHSCQAYDNGTLIRNVAGVRRVSDGEVGMYDRANGVFRGNDGAGTFIAGPATGEVIAEPAIARKIKKAYVGIGGVARPFWSDGTLAYYGTVTALSVARFHLAATSNNNYALFGGGNSGSTVDAYDKFLTRTTPSALFGGGNQLAATSIGNYALFGGGYGTSGTTNSVTAYNTSLTRSAPTVLATTKYQLAATSNNNYALFGGGYMNSYSKTVDAYDSSLTRSTPTVLSTARNYLAGTKVGDYALFGGGYNNYYLAVVDAYNKSLTRSTPVALSVARQQLAATHVGGYALFGGGNGNGASKVVDAYDHSLTRSAPTVFSVTRYSFAATTIENYALFGGNASTGSSVSALVDAYDASLTRTSPDPLSVGRYQFAATTVGDYALFGGGNTGSARDIVDAYTLV